jgi:hypothetical protein
VRPVAAPEVPPAPFVGPSCPISARPVSCAVVRVRVRVRVHVRWCVCGACACVITCFGA